jgi:hypothetical protein
MAQVRSRQQRAARLFSRSKEEGSRLVQAPVPQEESAGDPHIQHVLSCLEKAGKVPLFEFLLDPNSFSRTVENLFYLR